MPLAYLIGHPSIERTPLSEPWIQGDLPASETTEHGGRGGEGEKKGGLKERGQA
jgi:hypothetical protein